ncbi:MAG: hypothetical protein K9W44_03995 [Candidatus Lokiarchaeota archaeon]|nr:hypothetical protein [Candidatus Harpocratesius repetitus]
MQIFQKIYNEYLEKSKNVIILETQEKLDKIRKEISKNSEFRNNILEEIQDLYSNDPFPENSVPIFIGHLFMIFGANNKSNLKKILYDFIKINLYSKNLRNNLMALHIIRYNPLLFSLEDSEFCNALFDNLASKENYLICFSLAVLDRYSTQWFKLFKPYINQILKLCFEKDDECIKCYSIKLLGECYLRFSRNNQKLEWNHNLINNLVLNYKKLKNISAKTHYLEGLSWLLYEYEKYSDNWIVDLISEFNIINDIGLKSSILRCLTYITCKAKLTQKSMDRYIEFYSPILERFITYESLELPPDSIIYKPNLIQDVLKNIEQISFYCPVISEKLLDLFEKVYKIIKKKNSSTFFFSLLTQWIHSVYVNLIKYYKKK